MITLPVVLIAVAVLLLLGLFLGLFLQRRRTGRAVPAGPRTVADLVAARSGSGTPAPLATPVAPAAPAAEEPEPVVASPEAAVAESAPAPAPEPEPEAEAEPESDSAEPVVAARAVPPLGDDVPWRRAAQIAGSGEPEPEPAEQRRVPALTLLGRPSRRPDGPATDPGPAASPGGAAAPVAVRDPDDGANAEDAPADDRRSEPDGVRDPDPDSDHMVDPDPVLASDDARASDGVHESDDVREPDDVRGPDEVPVMDPEPGSQDTPRTDDVLDAETAPDPQDPAGPDPADGSTDAEPAGTGAPTDIGPVASDPVVPDAPTPVEPAPVPVPVAAVGAGTVVVAAALARDADRDDPAAPGPGSDDLTGPIPVQPVDDSAAFPEADPDLLFDTPAGMTAVATPVPEAAEPEVGWPPPPSAVEPPARRAPRDPQHLAAEQAAADLALLRTFGDPSARPERAPVVALEGASRPEGPPAVGAAQPVRFRAVRRDGTAVADAAVALLDDRGREVSTGRSEEGGMTAPHPGSYVVVATAPDHQPGAVALTVGDAPVDVEVLLARSAALVGTVTGEDGPIRGARVTLVQDGEVVEVAETDVDGAYLVADLAAGEYAVSVAAAGCEADVVLVVVTDEAERVHDVELEPAGVPAG